VTPPSVVRATAAPPAGARRGRRAGWFARLAVLSVAAALGGRTAGLAGATLAVAGVAGGPPLGALVRRRRAARRYDDELVGLLRAVARGLRSGATLRAAVLEAASGMVGPLAADLADLSARLDDGVVPALRAWAEARPTPSVRLVAGGLALGHVTGGITARVVDSLAETIRLGLDGRDEAIALSTQAALSAVVMAGVPLAFLVLGALGGGSSSRFLLHRPVGRACLAGGLALDAASLAWMLKMVRGVGR
jgi:tight adherence protein B